MADPVSSTTFSFSRAKTFVQCPRRYRFRYLERRREAFRSVEAFLGESVHAVLEWQYGERAAGRSPTLTEVRERFASVWNDADRSAVAVVRSGDEEESSYRDGLEMLERFYQGSFRRDRSDTIALERRYRVDLGSGLVFTGVADRIGRTTSGRLFVVDYKTSRRQGDGSDLSEGLQAPLYAACAMDEHGDDAATAGYAYLRHGTTSWQPVDRSVAAGVRERFRALAFEAVAATEFPPRPGPLCAWCGFNHVCSAANIPRHLAGGLEVARHLEPFAPPE